MNKYFDIVPANKVFNEVVEKSIEIWRGYDDTHGYATERINAIKSLKNVRDNVMHIIEMFDWSNQQKLVDKLTPTTKDEIRKRLIGINQF